MSSKTLDGGIEDSVEALESQFKGVLKSDRKETIKDSVRVFQLAST